VKIKTRYPGVKSVIVNRSPVYEIEFQFGGGDWLQGHLKNVFFCL